MQQPLRGKKPVACHFYHYPNLFVVDGSCFVSSGCVNPTLAIQAMAVRASEYLIEEYKRGGL
jgi:choline dehydrogenase-like flavoprotein